MFYEDYLNKGGIMEFKVWGSKRWFSKQPKLPTIYGKERIPPEEQ